ncbi:metabotropic glutamate receptor 1-like [Amphiura filiformis]|uniref:metabotropic glutamate receptor 1-like n=1 Tax=Amphiura filiformis TaxID=82378 RepID=UPI003B227E44
MHYLIKLNFIIYIVTILTTSYLVKSEPIANIHPAGCVSLTKAGDFTLGGIFPVHFSGRGCDGTPSMWSIQLIEAMKFAIEDINSRDDILPNITLGWDIRDDCFLNEMSLWAAMTLVNDGIKNVSQLIQCPALQTHNGNVFGIIGPLTSPFSILVETTSSIFHVPIISYGATSDELSDETQFPYFLRSVPPDRLQAEAIVDLIAHFNWEYVAVIYEANSYGIRGAHALQTYAENRGICIAVSKAIQPIPSEQDLFETVEMLRTVPKATTIVVFATGLAADRIVMAFKEGGDIHKYTWVGSEAWGHDLARDYGETPPVGGLFVKFFNPQVPDFISHFQNLSDESITENRWFSEHWESFAENTACSGKPSDCEYLNSIDFTQTGPISPVIDAVYAHAYGLHSLLVSSCGDLHSAQRECIMQEIDGKTLLKHLKQVSFEGTRGLFQFNDVGDLEGKYVWTNLQTEKGEYKLINVGVWDALDTSSRLTVFEHKIQWIGAGGVGQSICREDCRPGQVVIPLQQKCCWGCRQCPANAIVVNGTGCFECYKTEWPDITHSVCKTIKPDFVSLTDTIILLITILAAVEVILSLCVTTGVVYYFEHPAVKATSRELSGVNIIGLFFAGLAVFSLLITPNVLTCCLSEILVSFCFTLTYAPTLLKVNRIHRIFQSSRSSTQRPKYTSPKEQMILVCFFICIQVIMMVPSVFVSPSKPAFIYPSPPDGHLELFCQFSYGFLASCSYNLMLILACCYYAFRARKVPDNFNESKFIAVSVYSTLILCLAAVSLYSTSNNVVQKVVAIAMAVLLNAFLTMVCVYLPKLYAIHFLGNDEVEQHRSLGGTSFSNRPVNHSASRNNQALDHRVHPQ